MPFEYHLVLVEPDIPQNTGAVARLCLATGSTLHLVGRLGFHLSDRQAKRPGLDYFKHARVQRHVDFQDFQNACDAPLYLIETSGDSDYWTSTLPPRAAFVFGAETRGLPDTLLQSGHETLRVPIYDERVRSLNVAMTAGIVLYEAIRQNRSINVPQPTLKGVRGET